MQVSFKKMYENGRTLDEIAKFTECPRSRCYRSLKLEGTKFRKVGRRKKVNPKAIAILREKGMSYREIAELLQTSHICVYNNLREYRMSPKLS